MKKLREKEESAFKILKVRLDAIVAILIRSKFADKKGKIKIGEAAPLLYHAGYAPKDIAKLLGKKKSSEVAPYLYSKGKGKKK